MIYSGTIPVLLFRNLYLLKNIPKIKITNNGLGQRKSYSYVSHMLMSFFFIFQDLWSHEGLAQVSDLNPEMVESMQTESSAEEWHKKGVEVRRRNVNLRRDGNGWKMKGKIDGKIDSLFLMLLSS